MPKNITIFTTSTCSYCSMVKRYLDSKKLQYEVINLEEKPEMQATALELSGALTVPITVVTHQDDRRDVVVGYNLARLAPAVA